GEWLRGEHLLDAAGCIEEVLAAQPLAVVVAHQLHQRPAAWSEMTGRDTEVRPRLRRVLLQPIGLPGRRTNTVSRDDDDILQPRRFGRCRDGENCEKPGSAEDGTCHA